jgi:hypothetical protein
MQVSGKGFVASALVALVSAAALFSIKSYEEVDTRLGSAYRVVQHLSKDGMQDLESVVTDFVAEFDIFLSTAGSADGVRSSSGLVGKCVWPPQLPGHALGVPVSYTGMVNPWGVTSLPSPCLPQCRIHPGASQTSYRHGVVTGINYTEYFIMPDAAIYTMPYCWRVKRVGANRFQVLAGNVDGHRQSTEYPRVSMALMRHFQALGWSILSIEHGSWTMSADNTACSALSLICPKVSCWTLL